MSPLLPPYPPAPVARTPLLPLPSLAGLSPLPTPPSGGLSLLQPLPRPVAPPTTAGGLLLSPPPTPPAAGLVPSPLPLRPSRPATGLPPPPPAPPPSPSAAGLLLPLPPFSVGLPFSPCNCLCMLQAWQRTNVWPLRPGNGKRTRTIRRAKSKPFRFSYNGQQHCSCKKFTVLVGCMLLPGISRGQT